MQSTGMWTRRGHNRSQARTPCKFEPPKQRKLSRNISCHPVDLREGRRSRWPAGHVADDKLPCWRDAQGAWSPSRARTRSRAITLRGCASSSSSPATAAAEPAVSAAAAVPPPHRRPPQSAQGPLTLEQMEQLVSQPAAAEATLKTIPVPVLVGPPGNADHLAAAAANATPRRRLGHCPPTPSPRVALSRR